MELDFPSEEEISWGYVLERFNTEYLGYAFLVPTEIIVKFDKKGSHQQATNCLKFHGENLMSVAFFDLDGTLIKTKSLVSFFEYYIDTNPTLKTRLSWQLIEYAMQHLINVGVARDVLNQWFYQKNFSGLDVSELATSASAWFEEKRHTNFFCDAMVAKLKEHKNLGAEIVIVTGSFREVVKPIADYLEVSELLCAPLEIIDGKYSGQLTALPMIGKGKAEAIKRYLSLRGDAEPYYGYGDDFSDMNFLELVDKPVAWSTCGPTDFLKIARSQSWKIIESS